MPLRRRGDAERVLGHVLTDFADIVQRGNESFWAEYGARAHILEPWTKRSIIRDEIVQLLIGFTDGVEGGSWSRTGNATYFYYFGEFIIKVNKLDDFLLPNVNSTSESRAYFTQQPDLFCWAEMDELNRTGDSVHLEPTTIFLGYVPTENDPRNPQAYLVCFNDRGGLEWDIPLKRSGPAPSSVAMTPQVDGGESSSRVRILPAAKKVAG